MSYFGALIVTLLETSPEPGRAIYGLTFVGAGAHQPGAPVFRCHGDARLVRVLEDLVESAERRGAILERLRVDGVALTPTVALSPAQAAKYGFVQPSDRMTEDPICPVCSWPVRFEEAVAVNHGEVIHEQCRTGARDVTESLARFLKQSDGRTFCHTCLSGLLSIEFDEARKVVGILRGRSGFAVGTTKCSACRKTRVTIQSSQVSPERRLRFG